VGDRTVIWGGKKPGIGTSLFLAEKGKRSLVVCRERKVGKDVNPSFIWRYIQKMRDKKVTVYKSSEVGEIGDNMVVIKAPYHTSIPVKADTVVYAEREPIGQNIKDFAKKEGMELHIIGDALVPRTMSNALHDGYRTGIRI
jgi:2,4-dienoyl-CoA reductase (NADPH2)